MRVSRESERHKQTLLTVANSQQRLASMDFNGGVSALCQAEMNKMGPSELTAELETQMTEHNEKLSYGSMYGVL